MNPPTIQRDPSRRHKKVGAIVLIALGLTLVAASSGYYTYAAVARSGLEKLNYIVENTANGTSTEPIGPAYVGSVIAKNKVVPSAQSSSLDSQRLAKPKLFSPYPGTLIDPRYWGNPIEAAPPDPSVARIEAETATYSRIGLDELAAGAPPATRILIPAIGLESKVKELELLDVGDSKVWETPNQVVGHIPTTATPGQQDQGWYFGHLESPIRGEGSVFRNLPKIPELLREGEPVYIVLEGPERKYLYQVYKTEVLRREELQITNSDKQEITLATCVPRLVYDHRLLVTAELIGVSELDSSAQETVTGKYNAPSAG